MRQENTHKLLGTVTAPGDTSSDIGTVPRSLPAGAMTKTFKFFFFFLFLALSIIDDIDN